MIVLCTPSSINPRAPSPSNDQTISCRRLVHRKMRTAPHHTQESRLLDSTISVTAMAATIKIGSAESLRRATDLSYGVAQQQFGDKVQHQVNVRSASKSLLRALSAVLLILHSNAAQSQPTQLPRSCLSSIERAAASAGFSLKPEGYLLSRMRQSSSAGKAEAAMWGTSKPPTEISYAEVRSKGKFYVSLTLPPSPERGGVVTPRIQEKIRQLQNAAHRQVDCIQTLRIEFLRSGPYECTWLDRSRNTVRNIQHLEAAGSGRGTPRPGFDYCD